MFKNLKKRVEQEGGDGLLAAVASGAVSGFRSPHSSVRSTSHESLSDLGGDRRLSISSTATPIPEEIATEELLRKITRLQTALDRQQSGFDRRMKKSEEEWEEKVRQVEAGWQTKYDVLKENLTAILDKNARLEEEWPALEARAKDGEGYKEKLILLQDELDTMQGLQNQEIAKVKHLLIQKEKEFVDLQSRGQEVAAELFRAKKEVENLSKDLENYRNSQRSCSELQDRCDSLQFQLDASESKRTKETGEYEAVVNELREKVATLEQRLGASELGDDDRVHALALERAGLEKKLEETREQLTNVKTTWSSKIDALERQISHLNEGRAEESAENAKLAEALERTRRERDEAADGLARLSAERDGLEAACSELRARVADLGDVRQRLGSAEAELESLRSAEGRLRSEVASLNIVVGELKPFRTRAENAESSLSNLQQQLSSLKEAEAQSVSAKKEVEALRASEAELTSKLKRREDKLAAVEAEVERLKPFAEAAKKAQDEVGSAKLRIEELEKRVKELTARSAKCEELEGELKSAREQVGRLESDVSSSRSRTKELEAANDELSSRSSELEAERDRLMMRNAEVSQMLELARRTQRDGEDQLKTVEAQLAELSTRLADAENLSEEKVEKLDAMVKARQTVDLLEEQLVEKNKTIRLQNQRINDMKKALQKELNSKASSGANSSNNAGWPKQNSVPGDSSSEESGHPAGHSVNSGYHHHPQQQSSRQESFPPPTLAVTSSDDVNFTYMRNVVLHILTSKGSEALHMTKALATVLKLSPDEERLVKDTLEWRLSWFGQKPDLNKFL